MDYTPLPQKFFFAGISDWPSDALSENKFPYVLNVRPYIDGSLKPRAGLTPESNNLGAGIHTLARLNDDTELNGGVAAVRLLGAGNAVFRGDATGTTYASVDSGYSGNPLMIVSGQPPAAPRPYAYVADSSRMRKFTTDGGPYLVGLAQPSAPSTEPAVSIDVQHISDHDIQTSTAWDAAGAVASVPTTTEARIDTTISQILYDDPATNTGYCSIVPANTANITVGTLLTVGPDADFENALITDITIAVADDTVGAIIYDAGTTGLCTIQPSGSLGVGQIDAPSVEAYRRRAFRQQGVPFGVPRGEAGGLPPDVATDPAVRRIRQVDFPVNAIIDLGGEIVRILSVAVGEDGVQSFRCQTSTTIAVGAAITGLTAFRIFLASTRTPGEQLRRGQLTNTLTYPDPLEGERAYMTGGIQTQYTINLAQFSNGQAVLPEDEIHIAIKVDRLTEVISVRLYVDIDETTNDFLQNYFFHEWRASDIVSAIQGTNAANVVPLIDARKTVVANQQLESNWGFLHRQSTDFVTGVLNEFDNPNTPGRPKRRDVSPPADTALATQLALGNNQWVDLRVKIGTLTHVGTDPSRTLANAKAFEILLACQGLIPDTTPAPLTVAYSDIQIYGGGGVDVGEVGDPYVYVYRYRSSATGVVSNPSPHSRGGVIPRRQDVHLVATPSSDSQVDRIDWFRIGGTLPAYAYVGTGPNSSAVYVDNRMDQFIEGGEDLAYDNFQLWPTQDAPATGTCNVSGTAISRASGDAFDTNWAPGSIILVNGRATTLYASPASTNLLFVVDNVGSGTGVEFSLPGPTLMGQPLPRFWGDYQGAYFACGDPLNPGTLYWTHGNNLEAASDAFTLLVTNASEPLVNGGVANVFAFVFSTEDLYTILRNQDGSFRTIKTACGRGLWAPWAFCIAPEGIYFLAKDGLFLTAFGAPAQSITLPDLRNVFPKDGLPGETTNLIPAPDMSQPTRLRLNYIAGFLYFDYVSR